MERITARHLPHARGGDARADDRRKATHICTALTVYTTTYKPGISKVMKLGGQRKEHWLASLAQDAPFEQNGNIEKTHHPPRDKEVWFTQKKFGRIWERVNGLGHNVTGEIINRRAC